ncbi:MAG TPA: polyprenyl diphosphate synthase [Candidatus Saccharimonadales bacterium]|nr:polyprenyl diphosphate synthase [Candidatus Saccharimonadales bacterium]
MQDSSTITKPNHIGFILDGNRRWAKSHSIPSFDGHMAGYNALKDVLEGVYEHDIPYVSIYAFSNENWKRPSSEVSGLMSLMVSAVSKEVKKMIERGVRVRFMGRRDNLDDKVLGAIQKAEGATEHLTKGTLAICFNYGGQQEIVDAAKQCVADGLSLEAIDEQAIAERLYAPDIPPVDIVVRTSGEQRLSNFMLWRSAYSEFLFLEKYWPDMTKEDVTAIIEEYSRRSRRFGG